MLKQLLRGDAVQLVPDSAGSATPPAAALVPGTQSTTPFWMVDDHLQPGFEYQYRVRLVMFNPTFHLTIEDQPAKLEDESKRNEAVIMSAWALVPNSVEVQNDTYFFINGPLGGGQAGQQAIGIQVYKWVNGHWHVDHNVFAQPGMPITGKIILPPPDRKLLEVPTGNTVVDVNPVTIDKRDEVEVVLLTPAGEV